MEAQAKSTKAVRNGKITVQILSHHEEKKPATKPIPSSNSAFYNGSISSRIRRMMQRKKADAPTSDVDSQKEKIPEKVMIIGTEAANGKPATESKASSINTEDHAKPATASNASSINIKEVGSDSASASTPAWSFVSTSASTSGSESSPPPKVASSRIGSLFERMMPRKHASSSAKPEESPIEYVLFDDEGRPAWTMRRTTKETEADLPEELEEVDCVQLE